MTNGIIVLARGVTLNVDRILLAHTKGAANTFLPGGHANHLKSSQNALKREIREEMGLDSTIGRYLGAIEHRWFGAGFPGLKPRTHHEIAQHFVVSLAGLSSGNSPPAKEDHLEFFWVGLDDLERQNLLPVTNHYLIRRYATGDESIWWETDLV